MALVAVWYPSQLALHLEIWSRGSGIGRCSLVPVFFIFGGLYLPVFLTYLGGYVFMVASCYSCTSTSVWFGFVVSSPFRHRERLDASTFMMRMLGCGSTWRASVLEYRYPHFLSHNKSSWFSTMKTLLDNELLSASWKCEVIWGWSTACATEIPNPEWEDLLLTEHLSNFVAG